MLIFVGDHTLNPASHLEWNSPLHITAAARPFSALSSLRYPFIFSTLCFLSQLHIAQTSIFLCISSRYLVASSVERRVSWGANDGVDGELYSTTVVRGYEQDATCWKRLTPAAAST
jgi:hypothetical protein